MKKRVLFLCDLEGVNHVVGVPYHGLERGSEGWQTARRQAARELNAAAGALFDAGVGSVGLWDNHGGGNNIDRDDLDPRIDVVDPEGPRLSFSEGRYDFLCFFGYHAMEGTLGGVLAHTMSSATVQYYKLNGKYVGEVDMDAAIAASYGIPACFFAGGDIACLQARRALPGITTVVTKQELSRNTAVFRDDGDLFREIRERIVGAVLGEQAVYPLSFPAVMEKSFKRVEDAAAYLDHLMAGGIRAEHPEDAILGRDAHTVRAEIPDLKSFVFCI